MSLFFGIKSKEKEKGIKKRKISRDNNITYCLSKADLLHNCIVETFSGLASVKVIMRTNIKIAHFNISDLLL